jgi:hypothetical protein
VPRASDPPGVDGWHAIAPRFGDSVVAINQVVTSGCDFGEQDWARQIGRANGRFVQAGAAIIGDVRHQDGFERFRQVSMTGAYMSD